jgi:hypothetical protein
MMQEAACRRHDTADGGLRTGDGIEETGNCRQKTG